jgi:hypothetical protein
MFQKYRGCNHVWSGWHNAKNKSGKDCVVDCFLRVFFIFSLRVGKEFSLKSYSPDCEITSAFDPK